MRALLGCLVLVFAACGGGSAESGPKSAADTSSASESSHDDSGAADSESGEETAATSAPKGPSCDDGTCSLCGSGICPAGWYCDEKASACSWLKECADKPSCGCVSRVLGSGCKCREEAGGLKVACD